MSGKADEIFYTGKHLRMRAISGWEFVERVNCRGVVGIIAITDDDKVILVEQFRVPVQVPVIELPAGLAGDEPGKTDEQFAEAALRELLEETGYEAPGICRVASGPASAGMTTEAMTLFLARNVRKTSQGGGVAGERIILHEVPLDHIPRFVREQEALGKMVDLKVFLAAHFARM